MFTPERNRVLHNGVLPPGPFATRELALSPIAAAPLPSDARAIVYVAGDLTADANRVALVQWVRRNLASALDQGVACIITALEEQKNLAKATIANNDKTGQVLVLSEDAEIVAQACLRHEPGPFPDGALTITAQRPLQSEIETLLRRAFHGFQRLTLHSLAGGRSNADGVWRVDAEASDRELRSPFVVKCGQLAQIGVQVATYRDVVADRVPFRGCAPLCLERSLAGSTRRLSVSRFVEGGRRLDEVLLDADCPNVADLMSRIYSGPLHRWRQTTERRTVSLYRQFLPREMEERFLGGLIATHDRLTASGAEIAAPHAIIERLKALPTMSVPMCRAHDDLNFRNVFVTEGPGEIVLIDFTRAIVRPLSRDVARLDVGLAFDIELNERQPIEDTILIDFFTEDLFAISLPHIVVGRAARARLAAIQALRHQVLIEASALGYDPALEYKVCVITELLYQAKRDTKWAGVAYRCAEALSSSLTADAVRPKVPA